MIILFFFFGRGGGGGGVKWEMCKWQMRELLTSKFLGRNRKKKHKIDVLRLTTSTLKKFIKIQKKKYSQSVLRIQTV